MLIERDAPGEVERARDLLNAAHTAAVTHGYAGIERAPPKHSNTSIGTGRCRSPIMAGAPPSSRPFRDKSGALMACTTTPAACDARHAMPDLSSS